MKNLSMVTSEFERDSWWNGTELWAVDYDPKTKTAYTYHVTTMLTEQELPDHG